VEHLFRRLARIQRDAGVTLLLRAVEVRVPALRVVDLALVLEVGGLRLGLLEAEVVGLLRLEPVEQALAGGRADAVAVEGNDSHGRGILLAPDPWPRPLGK